MWCGLGSISVSKSIQDKYYFIPLLLLVKAEAKRGEWGDYYSLNEKKIKTQMKNTENVEVRSHLKPVVPLN